MGYNEELLAMARKNELKKSDAICFECKMCGDCCKNREREKIMLTGADVYRAARALGLQTEDFILNYCNVHVGNMSRCPIITLQARDPGGACPLLEEDGRCTIQCDKPTVCAIYPLGRYYDTENQTYHYFTQDDEHCPGSSATKKTTLKEWRENFNLEEADKYAKAWHELFAEIMRLVKDITINDKMIRTVFYFLYAGYSFDAEPFEEQTKARIHAFRQLV